MVIVWMQRSLIHLSVKVISYKHPNFWWRQLVKSVLQRSLMYSSSKVYIDVKIDKLFSEPLWFANIWFVRQIGSGHWWQDTILIVNVRNQEDGNHHNTKHCATFSVSSYIMSLVFLWNLSCPGKAYIYLTILFSTRYFNNSIQFSSKFLCLGYLNVHCRMFCIQSHFWWLMKYLALQHTYNDF